MKKKPIFIANWKMYLNFRESLALAEKIRGKIGGFEAEIAVCPPFTALEKVGEALKSTGIGLGAQDVFWQGAGAYTGEISPPMLKELGCRYVIVGHSERRKYLRESDETVNLKLRAALSGSLVPVVCVGETMAERKAGKGGAAVAGQLRKAFDKVRLTGRGRIIVAYEPIWAIGTGKSATPENAEAMAKVIRSVLAKLCPSANLFILYGGSVDGSNVGRFVSRAEIDGVLVGGASVKIGEFAKMIKAISHP